MHWIIEKAREFQKNIYSASLTMQKPLTVWTTANYGKFLKKWEIYMWDRKRQLELDMEQLIGSKLGKGYDKTVYCPPAYLTYTEYIMQKPGLNESQAGIKIARININNLRYTDNTTLMAESEEELRNILMRVKEESAKMV